MKNKIIIILLILLILFISFLLVLKYFKEKPIKDLMQKQALKNAPQKTGEEKKAAIIIAFRNFRDEEYFQTAEVLAKGEIELTIVSDQKGIAVGTDGGQVHVDLTLEDLLVEEFDAILFIGGPGAKAAFDNESAYNIAQEAVKKDKTLAAICIAPTILAKSGALEGKRATVWASSEDKSSIKILEENGALFVDEKVVQDGNIITGNGKEASEEFGQRVLENIIDIKKNR